MHSQQHSNLTVDHAGTRMPNERDRIDIDDELDLLSKRIEYVGNPAYKGERHNTWDGEVTLSRHCCA